MNLAITNAKKYNVKVIAAELRPGQGSWALDLNLSEPVGLPNLLSKELVDITMDAVSNELIQTSFGIKILSASNKTENIEYVACTPQLELVLDHLSNLANMVILDIGTSFHPGFNAIRCPEWKWYIRQSVHNRRLEHRFVFPVLLQMRRSQKKGRPP